MRFLRQAGSLVAIALLLGAAPATQPTANTTADCCADPTTRPASAEASALFEKMKSLVGTWTAAGDQPTTVDYALTGGGSAIVETWHLHGGMITVYTLDGDRVVATHYCAAGNQPRMTATKLDAAGDAKTATFAFLDATGLASPDASHMHGLTFTFTADGSLGHVWTMYDKGQPSGEMRFEFKRTQ